HLTRARPGRNCGRCDCTEQPPGRAFHAPIRMYSVPSTAVMISAGHYEPPAELLRAEGVAIAERGKVQVSMRTGAATAGVSVGRIQYRFRSKAELLHASLKAMLRAAVDEHIVATAQAGSFETLWHLLAQPIPRGETARLGV